MKIWILVTDTKNGVEIHKFDSEAEFDSFMTVFIAGYYPPLPTWWEAWEAEGNVLSHDDTFQFEEFDVEPKRKWSVELTRTDHFDVEVEAETEQEARDIAIEILCQSETPYETYGSHCDGFETVGCQ